MGGYHPTQENNPRDYLQDIPLAEGVEPAFAEPTPPPKALKERLEDDTEPGEDFVSEVQSDTPSQKNSNEGKGFKGVTHVRKLTQQAEPPRVEAR
jgi:hypothetical protein